jgi:prephenate dehydrogenase
VAVPNRPGVVAEVALALGRAGVNIGDMALYPTADRSSGTIALWIAGAERAAEAQALVEGLGLSVARP